MSLPVTDEAFLRLSRRVSVLEEALKRAGIDVDTQPLFPVERRHPELYWVADAHHCRFQLIENCLDDEAK